MKIYLLFQFNSGIGDAVLSPNTLLHFKNQMRFQVVAHFFELNHIRIYREACGGLLMWPSTFSPISGIAPLILNCLDADIQASSLTIISYEVVGNGLSKICLFSYILVALLKMDH